MPAAAQQKTMVSSTKSGSQPPAMPRPSERITGLDHMDQPKNDDN